MSLDVSALWAADIRRRRRDFITETVRHLVEAAERQPSLFGADVIAGAEFAAGRHWDEHHPGYDTGKAAA